MKAASYELVEATLHIHLRQPAATHRRALEVFMGVPIKNRDAGETPDLIILTFKSGEAGAMARRERITGYLRQHNIYHRAVVEKVYDPGLERCTPTPAILHDLIARRLDRNVMLKSVVDGDRVGLFADIPDIATMELPIPRRYNDELRDVEAAYMALVPYLEGHHRMEPAVAKDSAGVEREIGFWVYCLRKKKKNAS